MSQVQEKDMKTFNLIFPFYQDWSFNGQAAVNVFTAINLFVLCRAKPDMQWRNREKLNDKKLFIKTSFSFIHQSLIIFF